MFRLMYKSEDGKGSIMYWDEKDYNPKKDELGYMIPECDKIPLGDGKLYLTTIGHSVDIGICTKHYDEVLKKLNEVYYYNILRNIFYPHNEQYNITVGESLHICIDSTMNRKSVLNLAEAIEKLIQEIIPEFKFALDWLRDKEEEPTFNTNEYVRVKPDKLYFCRHWDEIKAYIKQHIDPDLQDMNSIIKFKDNGDVIFMNETLNIDLFTKGDNDHKINVINKLEKIINKFNPGIRFNTSKFENELKKIVIYVPEYTDDDPESIVDMIKDSNLRDEFLPEGSIIEIE